MLKGKAVLVTGASSGIGRAAAIELASCGAAAGLVGRKPEHLQQTADAIQNTGGTAVCFVADLSSDVQCRHIVQNVVDHFGRLDALINAAGIIGTGTIENTTAAEWGEMMSINLDSVFRMMQYSIPHLEKTGGSIVNVSSVTGLRSFPGVLAYCVSKAGVDQLTRCAALELAPKGIRVNAVNPGVVETNLHRRAGMDELKYQSFLEHSRTTHPLGRAGSPGEIASLIAFLASDRSGWITGACIPIDGGRHLTCAR